MFSTIIIVSKKQKCRTSWRRNCISMYANDLPM